MPALAKSSLLVLPVTLLVAGDVFALGRGTGTARLRPRTVHAASAHAMSAAAAQVPAAQPPAAQAAAPQAVPPNQPAPSAPAPEQPAPAKPPLPTANITPGEFNRLFEAYALLQAQNMLRLTDDQYAEFIVRLKALQNARRQHQQQRTRLVQDLRKLAVAPDATGDEAGIRTVLDTLAREDARAYEEIKGATEQVDELLDVQQRARFRVFEDQLDRWKLDLLSRVRRASRDRSAAPGRPPGAPKSPPSASRRPQS